LKQADAGLVQARTQFDVPTAIQAFGDQRCEVLPDRAAPVAGGFKAGIG
jgi:hypothetical protein